jgi:outer membrane protein OmpA-like peptidoglycan-associated protein
MRRFFIIAAIFIVAASLGFFGYRIERHLRASDQTMSDLSREVTEAMQMAKEEAAAASSASQRATEAAARAQTAAGQKAQAEQQRDQAQTARSQAESAALQATQQANAAQTQLSEIRKKRQQELDQMQQALSHVAETKRTANGMVMILPDSIFKFDFDSADLKPRNRELLSRVAGILLASKGFGLSIFGYTDDVGTKAYNQKLSERRADAVRDYLVQAGIEPGIVNAKGFGKTNPRVEGETQEARATNRRVEIAVTDSEINYGDPASQ